jgi:hypothetical protein
MKGEMEYSEALRGLIKDFLAYDLKYRDEMEGPTTALRKYPTSLEFKKWLNAQRSALDMFGLKLSGDDQIIRKEESDVDPIEGVSLHIENHSGVWVLIK